MLPDSSGPPTRSPSCASSALAAASSCVNAKSRSSSQAFRSFMVRCGARPAATGHRRALTDLPSDAGAQQNLQEVLSGDWLGARKPRAGQSPRESGREPWRPAHPDTSQLPKPVRRRASCSAFKTPSPSMRCPLLIGCAATTNHRLPLGLPGAHRPRKSAGENKGG